MFGAVIESLTTLEEAFENKCFLSNCRMKKPQNCGTSYLRIVTLKVTKSSVFRRCHRHIGTLTRHTDDIL